MAIVFLCTFSLISAKSLYNSFSDDFRLQELSPSLQNRPYYPNSAPTLREGLYAGVLSKMAESMTAKESDGTSRVMNFGEFVDKYAPKLQLEPFAPSLEKPFDDAANLFLDFHPRSKPILWRILIAQVHIYEALENTLKEGNSNKSLKIMSLE